MTDADKEITEFEEQKFDSKADVIREYEPKSKTLKIVLLAIFTALGPVLSLSFVWFPFFELMTLTIFIGGMVLGPGYAVVLAIFSTTLLELIASLAVGPGLPIYPFKVIAFICIAVIGGFIGKVIPEKNSVSWRIFIATIGGLGTLFYDLLVTIGMVIFLEASFVSYFGLVLGGLPITALRVATNTMLFTFIPEIYNRAIKPNVLTRQKESPIIVEN